MTKGAEGRAKIGDQRGCQDGSERSIGTDSAEQFEACGVREASFKIGIIMFFHLSELETMTRRLSILWEQKSVRKTSAGFSSLFVFFFFFFSSSSSPQLSNNEATDRVGRIPSREGHRAETASKLKDNRIKVAFVRVYKDRLHAPIYIHIYIYTRVRLSEEKKTEHGVE